MRRYAWPGCVVSLIVATLVLVEPVVGQLKRIVRRLECKIGEEWLSVRAVFLDVVDDG